MIIFLWPFFLIYFIWKNEKFTQKTKIIATITILILITIAAEIQNSKENTPNNIQNQKTQENTTNIQDKDTWANDSNITNPENIKNETKTDNKIKEFQQEKTISVENRDKYAIQIEKLQKDCLDILLKQKNLSASFQNFNPIDWNNIRLHGWIMSLSNMNINNTIGDIMCEYINEKWETDFNGTELIVYLYNWNFSEIETLKTEAPKMENIFDDIFRVRNILEVGGIGKMSEYKSDGMGEFFSLTEYYKINNGINNIAIYLYGENSENANKIEVVANINNKIDEKETLEKMSEVIGKISAFMDIFKKEMKQNILNKKETTFEGKYKSEITIQKNPTGTETIIFTIYR